MKNSQLLALKVKNYRSFYTEQTIRFGDGKANNVTAIYGPNASGKSNIAKALQFVRWFIINSTNASLPKPPREPFLLRSTSAKEDSSFELDIIHRGTRFQYAFALNNDSVTYEELREFASITSKARIIFRRQNGKMNASAEKFGFGKRIVDSTRPGSLLITKAFENNNEYAAQVFDWLQSFNVLLGQMNETTEWSLNNMKVNTELKEAVSKLLQDADFWIRKFDIESVDVPQAVVDGLPFNDDIKKEILASKGQAASVKTVHAVRDSKHKIVGEQLFDLIAQESTGTQRFFGLAAPIIHTLQNGMVMYIDEFETYLHPDLCRFVVSLFASKANTKGAQLIINTHDTSLMAKGSLLKREGIIFLEKNYTEESVVTALSDKSVRTNEPFEKRYREGLYGAKPQLDFGE